jgi:hypothetical protein
MAGRDMKIRPGSVPAPPLLEDDSRSTRSLGQLGPRRHSLTKSSSASPVGGRKPGVDVDVSRTPRTGRKREMGSQMRKKAHNPLGVFDRIVKQEFGAEYLQDANKSGFFKTKNIEAKPLLDNVNPNAVVSMSTKTQTEKRTDGQYEVKTITKIKRVDGSVEKDVKVSIVNKEETKNLPKNTDLSIKRKVVEKKVEKRVEKKVEEKEEKKKDKKDKKKDKKDKKEKKDKKDKKK